MVGNGLMLYSNDLSHAVWQELDTPLIGMFLNFRKKIIKKCVNSFSIFQNTYLTIFVFYIFHKFWNEIKRERSTTLFSMWKFTAKELLEHSQLAQLEAKLVLALLRNLQVKKLLMHFLRMWHHCDSLSLIAKTNKLKNWIIIFFSILFIIRL